MLEEDVDRNTSHRLRAYLSSLKRCFATFFWLIRNHWMLSFVGTAILVCGSIPYLVLGTTYAQYGHHLKRGTHPQITIFLAESTTAAEADILSRMVEAVTRTNEVTVVPPSMTAAQVTQTLGLPADVAEEVNFPHLIYIKFPVASEASSLETLIRHLRSDRRVSEITSNIKNIDFLRALERNIVLLLSGGLVLISTGAFLISFYSTNIYGRSCASEMRALRLLGASDSELIRPLIFCGAFNALTFSITSSLIALALAKAIGPFIHRVLAFFESDPGNPNNFAIGILIYLGMSFVSVILGTLCSSRKTLEIAKVY